MGEYRSRFRLCEPKGRKWWPLSSPIQSCTRVLSQSPSCVAKMREQLLCILCIQSDQASASQDSVGVTLCIGKVSLGIDLQPTAPVTGKCGIPKAVGQRATSLFRLLTKSHCSAVCLRFPSLALERLHCGPRVNKDPSLCSCWVSTAGGPQQGLCG
jgi:hypothetical protein